MENETLEEVIEELPRTRLVQIRDKFHCDFVEYLPSDELDESKQIHITDEDRLAIGVSKCFDVENNCIIDYDNSEDLRVKEIQNLRVIREIECFSIVNRGKLWYNKLTDFQLEELDKWYQDWLNVTDTLIKPKKPEWLK